MAGIIKDIPPPEGQGEDDIVKAVVKISVPKREKMKKGRRLALILVNTCLMMEMKRMTLRRRMVVAAAEYPPTQIHSTPQAQ